MNDYVKHVADNLQRQYGHEPEYLQAVFSWLESIAPALEEDGLIHLLLPPCSGMILI